MGAIIETYIKLETLETLVKVIKQKGEKGVNITISVNDQVKSYVNKKADGTEYTTYQNVSSYVSQTKEQRDAKKDKFYIANGAVKWTDGSIKAAKDDGANVTQSTANVSQDDGDDLPF